MGMTHKTRAKLYFKQSALYGVTANPVTYHMERSQYSHYSVIQSLFH